MFTWRRLGKVFDPSESAAPPWMSEFAQSPSTVEFDSFLRVYFCSRPKPDPSGQYVSYAAYLDLDKKNPTRVLDVCRDPVLRLGGPGHFDEFGTNPVSAIRNESEIRLYYAGWTRCESVPFNAAIGLAVSQDGGLTFSRQGNGPVLSYSPDEPFLLGSPRIRKFGPLWYLFYVAGKRWLRGPDRPEPVYKLRMATSTDGVQWRKHGTNLLSDSLGPDECQACGDVSYREGAYHMFYSFRPAIDYKGTSGGYRIGYARSLDLKTWIRADELAGLHPDGAGWDSQMVSYPHLFSLGGRTHMLYQGNGMGRSGFGLAILESEKAWVER